MESVQNNKPIVIGASALVGAGAGYGIGKYMTKTKNTLPEQDAFIKNMTQELKSSYAKHVENGVDVFQQLKDYFGSFHDKGLLIHNHLLDILPDKAIKDEMNMRSYLHEVVKENAGFFGLEPTKTKSLEQITEEFIGNKKAAEFAKEVTDDIIREIKLKPDFEAGAKEYYNYLKDQIKNVKKTAPVAYTLIGAGIAGAIALGLTFLSGKHKKA